MSLLPNHHIFQRKWDRELRAEEADFNRREREAADRRWRQYRCENLFWRLWGIDQMDALKIAESVWSLNQQHWVPRHWQDANLWLEFEANEREIVSRGTLETR
jgi:hypothetical protein